MVSIKHSVGLSATLCKPFYLPMEAALKLPVRWVDSRLILVIQDFKITSNVQTSAIPHYYLLLLPADSRVLL